MKKMMFADVDGTFMDFNTYSMELSMEGVDLLRRNNIPLVLVSSKTYAEMTAIMDQAGLYNHFAFENGCGIAFPDGNGGYTTEISGPGTQVLKKKLILIEEITEKKFTSILDLADEEISAYSGLDMRRAALSKKRIATLPFISGDCELFSDSDIDELNIRLAGTGLEVTRGGRFNHLLPSRAGKSYAVRRIYTFYSTEGGVKTGACGDSYNDLDMLDNVDVGYIVRRPDGSYMTGTGFLVTTGAGPAGFTEAVKDFIKLFPD
ncbi:MAG TPA: HAD-IIB family hydrolase [Spirochaetota bacterium]|nr:HAD-IIB family hydrolase [Spirochaetota bacterium]HQO38945.1 HAD-IIB family hydrolase [Spirochaetota bacterium]